MKNDLFLEYNDQNGNQTHRLVHTIVNGQPVTQEFNMGYDAENRLVTVTGVDGTNFSAQFTYNGDGQRVKSVINGETIYFAGGHYEMKGNEITKYYFAGASRIAVRKYIVPQTTTLTYLLGDHLGSTSLAVDASTGDVVETRYKPWGEVRFTTEDLTEPIEEITLPTRYTFTGQYSHMNDEATDLGAAGFGLMFYNARWYDPMTGRMAQADTIVPGGVQGLDRYAYVNNSPVNYVDPSGHCAYALGMNSKAGCRGVGGGRRGGGGGGGGNGGGGGSGGVPTPVNERLLDDIRGTTGISGRDLYNVYLKMFDDKTGWWWSAFGGHFTIWDFFKVIMVYEAFKHWDDPNLAEAVTRAANAWCYDRYKSACSIEGYINFFAHYSQSIGDRVEKVRGGDTVQNQFDKKEAFDSTDAESLTKVTDALQDPGEWTRWDYDRPYGWGNMSLWHDNPSLQLKLSTNQAALFQYTDDKDPWVILSGCAAHNWVDPAFRDLEVSCPPVNR